jgi:hypothetical protein
MKLLIWDPGASGGLVFHNTRTGVMFCRSVPKTEGEFFTYLQRALRNTDKFVYEEVPKSTGAIRGQASMRKFGETYGFGRGIVYTLSKVQGYKFTIHSVRPVEWQKSIPLVRSEKHKKPKWFKHEGNFDGWMKKCSELDKLNDALKVQWKRDMRQFAETWVDQKKNPHCFPITLKTADAFLILRWALEKFHETT